MKLIRDAIYGDILLSDLAMKFVDTSEFQRLHYIKQLGLSYKVSLAQHIHVSSIVLAFIILLKNILKR